MLIFSSHTSYLMKLKDLFPSLKDYKKHFSGSAQIDIYDIQERDFGCTDCSFFML